ncbi:MAG: hypothetical protein RR022_02645 [Angelakisella sp.]
MTKNETKVWLNGAVVKKSLVALYRDELPDFGDPTGFAVATGPLLAVLARENDFAVDGYLAVRLEDITEAEQVDDNEFVRKLLTGERVYDKVTAPRLTGCDSWHALFGGIQASYGGWLTVEASSEEGSYFYLGSIARLDPNFLYLRQVDANGTVHPEETTVPLQDIVTVGFGGRYCELYRKYVKIAPLKK